MYKSLLVIPFILILIFTGCGKCDYVKQDEGKLIAQIEEEIASIQFPVKYCPKHGTRMVYGEPEIILRGYSRHSGEAIFSVSCLYYCPCLSWLGRQVAPPYGSRSKGYVFLYTLLDDYNIYLTMDNLVSGNAAWR